MIRRRALAGGGVAALAAFLGLTAFVTRNHGLAPPLDRSWHTALGHFGADHPGWLSTMEAITRLGDTATILAVDGVLILVCLFQRRYRLAAFGAVVGLGGWGLRILVRDLVGRPRPADPFWPAEGASFPSGHTTNATLMVALVVLVCWPWLRSRPARYAGVTAAVLLALAVGVSRVAGGVHWPTDVLGGWLLAAAWLCLISAVFPPVVRPPVLVTNAAG